MARRGISLIKLIVIIAIIAILIGLLLPVVAKVRAAANRTRSVNNIRQIGIALLTFHDANNGLPLLIDHGPNSASGFGVVSLHFHILPYLEYAELYQKLNVNEPKTYYNEKSGAARTIVRIYVSELDPAGLDGFVTPKGMEVLSPGAKDPFADKYAGYYATTNYVVNGQVFKSGPQGRLPGIRDIQDGTSNTIAIAERYQKCRRQAKDEDVVPTLWGMGSYSATTASFALAAPEGDKHPRTTDKMYELQQFVPTGAVPNKGEIHGTAGAEKLAFSKIARDANAAGGFQVTPRGIVFCDPRVPQALQATGLCVGLCDGSARTIAPSISPNTFWALVTPKGREELGQDW